MPRKPAKPARRAKPALKDVHIRVMVTASECEELKLAAERAESSLSRYVRLAALKEARQG